MPFTSKVRGEGGGMGRVYRKLHSLTLLRSSPKPADPCHSIECTTRQIFGTSDSTVPPTNRGFVLDYSAATGNSTYGAQIMDGFHPSHVPAIYNLSLEYAVYNGWYASVPGPTMVNRAYAASATSNGMGYNDPKREAVGLPQKTMFEQLLEMGLDYRVYFQQFPSVLQHKGLRGRGHLSKFRQLRRFFSDASSGSLPPFSWLEPGYFDAPGFSATDQHPDHDVSSGDDLIRRVYNAVRSSPSWPTTALVITYDEHGGFYDHRPPPQTAPSPDGIPSTDPPFEFDRLGVRVPTVIISPLIPKGTVVHGSGGEDGSGEYEHSSIPATVVHKIFQPAEGREAPTYLTKRDEWAATFEDVFSLNVPREDCPKEAPKVEEHRKKFPGLLPPLDGNMKVSELQEELVRLAADLEIEGKCGKDVGVLEGERTMKNEGEAVEWIMRRVEECLGMVLERQ